MLLFIIINSISTPEKLHSRVKTWTRRVDLFSKDYIILPVCDRWGRLPAMYTILAYCDNIPPPPPSLSLFSLSHTHRAHWYVVIVCHPGTFDPSKVFPRQPRSRQKAAKGNSKWNLVSEVLMAYPTGILFIVHGAWFEMLEPTK